MTKRIVVPALVGLFAMLTLMALPALESKEMPRPLEGFNDLQAETIAHLRRAADVTCEEAAIRYELEKALDLLVIQQIRDLKHRRSIPLTGALAAALDGVEASLAHCNDYVANAIGAGLKGDYAAAVERLSHARANFCGNAMEAEYFGRNDLLASLRFLMGDFDKVVTPPLHPESPRGSLSVDVRASRWAVAFALRSAAYEQLGQSDRAVTYICLAAAQAEHPEDSWGYYYPSDPSIWGQVVQAIDFVQHRLGADCTK